MNRFFLKGIFLFMIISISGIYPVAAQIPSEVQLYGNAPSKEEEGRRYNQENELTHIYGAVVPRLLVYKPDKACGTGIIVCPGGGYSKMNVENTRFIAERLTKLGITVFVLVYRLPVNDSSALKPVAALQDVQQAFRIVRKNAMQ
jgi:acetyl esterase/lipase